MRMLVLAVALALELDGRILATGGMLAMSRTARRRCVKRSMSLRLVMCHILLEMPKAHTTWSAARPRQACYAEAQLLERLV